MIIEGMDKKNVTLVVIIACIVVVVVGYEVLGMRNKEDVVVNQASVGGVSETCDNIEVYIVGCVKNPGTYEVPKGVTVGKVADKAGGFTEGADLERINLVYKINDNKMIVIKDKKERDREFSPKQKIVASEKSSTSCKKSPKNAKHVKESCDVEESKDVESVTKKKKSNVSDGTKKKKVGKKKGSMSCSDEKKEASVALAEDNTTDKVEKTVDNGALVEETLVNEVLKEETSVDNTKISTGDIADNIEVLPKGKRKKTGGNEQESGMEIIGGLYAEEKDAVGTMVNINTATKEELMTLKGVGKSMAESIIKYREDNGEFKEIDELKFVSGMGESKFSKIKDSIVV